MNEKIAQEILAMKTAEQGVVRKSRRRPRKTR
jgi:hypothetical protein